MSGLSLSHIFRMTFIDLISGQSYRHLMKLIAGIELNDDQKYKFTQALRGFYPLQETIKEIAAEFKLENKLNLVIYLIIFMFLASKESYLKIFRKICLEGHHCPKCKLWPVDRM